MSKQDFAPKAIRYIGNKKHGASPRIANGVVWAGQGDVQMVEHGDAVKLLRYPDTFELADPETAHQVAQSNPNTAEEVGVQGAERAAREAGTEPDRPTPDMIADAIDTMDPDEPAHRTATGKPKKAVVDEILGIKSTKAEFEAGLKAHKDREEADNGED